MIKLDFHSPSFLYTYCACCVFYSNFSFFSFFQTLLQLWQWPTKKELKEPTVASIPLLFILSLHIILHFNWLKCITCWFYCKLILLYISLEKISFSVYPWIGIIAYRYWRFIIEEILNFCVRVRRVTTLKGMLCEELWLCRSSK